MSCFGQDLTRFCSWSLTCRLICLNLLRGKFWLDGRGSKSNQNKREEELNLSPANQRARIWSSSADAEKYISTSILIQFPLEMTKGGHNFLPFRVNKVIEEPKTIWWEAENVAIATGWVSFFADTSFDRSQLKLSGSQVLQLHRSYFYL